MNQNSHVLFYVESRNTDPYFNLALEQFVFDSLDASYSFFMLWQNHNSIIVGKHQNTHAEINAAAVKELGINVVRRLSGGGAVYHDMGNLNYTFITNAGADDAFDFSAFYGPIKDALVSFGVPVETSGRNDMTVQGKKFSGNAQYLKRGRVLHHGTILYDSDLEMLSRALKVSNDKIESRGIRSVRGRVANIRPYMKKDLSIGEFWNALIKHIFESFSMREYVLSTEEITKVEELKERVYSQWAWNYGASPPHNVRKTRRVEGCGTFEILLDVGDLGIIKNVAFYGDFFGNVEPVLLAEMLKGLRLERSELAGALRNVDISAFFHNLDAETFLDML
ncbi:MAG: lipoate--protein ligase, partial [Treponema sp.]|nr:lipoate--protein ligase [Treponema sp.]